jgi:hypothetical protein
MNRCASCGRFKSWEELIYKTYHPSDRLDPREPDSWYECKKCIEEYGE